MKSKSINHEPNFFVIYFWKNISRSGNIRLFTLISGRDSGYIHSI